MQQIISPICHWFERTYGKNTSMQKIWHVYQIRSDRYDFIKISLSIIDIIKIYSSKN